MFGSCAASVVPPLPSVRSHVAEHVPPTPVAEAMQFAAALEFTSLNGRPKKPHTTPAVGAGAAEAWMCAARRLSFGSAVCVPVKSRFWMAATKVSDVRASLRKNDAVPNEVGRGAPVVSVGTAGGTSWLFVRKAMKVAACAS